MRLFLLTAICFLLMVGAQAAPSPSKAPYVPQETRVALLPVVGDRRTTDEAVSNARVSLGRQFVGHGFKVVPTPAVAAAQGSLKMTLASETPPTPEMLAKIGAAVNARLVVFVAVTQAGVPAGATVWVFDIKTHTFVVNNRSGIGTGRGVVAARTAVEAALAEFFKPYEFYDC